MSDNSDSEYNDSDSDVCETCGGTGKRVLSPHNYIEIPATLGPELVEFMGEPPGTKLKRTQVLKHISHYIQDNNLKFNGDRFKLDEKLRKVLRASDNEESIKYFALQARLSSLFVTQVE